MVASPRILTLDLRPGLGALADARAAIRSWLDSQADAELLEVVELLTTELLANAIEHGDGPTGAQVVLLDDAVRIEVKDRSPVLPRVRDPAPAARGGGRGLLLVEALSRRWGAQPNGSGKLTWCEVALVVDARPRGARRSGVVAADARVDPSSMSDSQRDDGRKDTGEADGTPEPERPDPDAPGSYVDDGQAKDVPEPNEPA